MKKEEKKFEKECKKLHEYLLSKLNHKWRLETWKDKYRARIRKYGLVLCKRAIDGFCEPPGNWYVRTLSNRAPELIFRSDKSLETFLTKAPEVPEAVDSTEAEERKKRVQEYRAKLEKNNSTMTARFFRRLKEVGLENEIQPVNWQTWIAPLLVVGMRNGTLVLFHENPSWVQEHYAARIEKALKCKPVRIVNMEEQNSDGRR
jgi:hypothetical protein